MENPVKTELESLAERKEAAEQRLDERERRESSGVRENEDPLPSAASSANDSQSGEGDGGAHVTEKEGDDNKLGTVKSANENENGGRASRVREREDPLSSANARAGDFQRADDCHSGEGGGGGGTHAVAKKDGDDKMMGAVKSENETDNGRKASLVPAREEDITPELIHEMEIKYAAYVRNDVFGTLGKGHLPITEKILVGLALATIVPVRLIFVGIVSLTFGLTFYLICVICTTFWLPGVQEGRENYAHLTGIRRRVIISTGRWFARSMLFVLGFYRIKEFHRNTDVMQRLRLGLGNEDNEALLEAAAKGIPAAIVSNHISYLDILYHMAASFPSFVAKKSVAELPFVGLMSKCMGCVYVQREEKSPNVKGVSGVIIERVQAAQTSQTAPVFLLFPEGTTTNGNYLLPFKTGAFLAGTPVLPVILNYPYRRFSPSWDTIAWIRHFILLLCQNVNRLEVTRLPVYYPSEKECSDPKAYANNVRTLMSVEKDLIPADIGLYEKRVYHAALAGKIPGPPSNPRKHRD